MLCQPENVLSFDSTSIKCKTDNYTVTFTLQFYVTDVTYVTEFSLCYRRYATVSLVLPSNDGLSKAAKTSDARSLTY
jgi:hypothetical protein